MARLRLSPLQGAILWMLEEAEAEDIPCILNTLWLHTGSRESEVFAAEVEAAALVLAKLGFVRFYKDLGQPGYNYVSLSKDELRAVLPLRELVRLTPHGWSYADVGQAGQVDGLMLTEEGKAALRR